LPRCRQSGCADDHAGQEPPARSASGFGQCRRDLRRRNGRRWTLSRLLQLCRRLRFLGKSDSGVEDVLGILLPVHPEYRELAQRASLPIVEGAVRQAERRRFRSCMVHVHAEPEPPVQDVSQVLLRPAQVLQDLGQQLPQDLEPDRWIVAIGSRRHHDRREEGGTEKRLYIAVVPQGVPYHRDLGSKGDGTGVLGRHAAPVR
jgi:hypothetical protein